jgi:hypothetical protein
VSLLPAVWRDPFLDTSSDSECRIPRAGVSALFLQNLTEFESSGPLPGLEVRATRAEGRARRWEMLSYEEERLSLRLYDAL